MSFVINFIFIFILIFNSSVEAQKLKSEYYRQNQKTDQPTVASKETSELQSMALYIQSDLVKNKVSEQIQNLNNYKSEYQIGTIQTELIPVQLPRLIYEMNWQNKPEILFTKDQIEVSLKGLRAQILIPEIKINAMINKIIGSTQINVKVESQCLNTMIEVTTNAINSHWQLRSQPAGVLDLSVDLKELTYEKPQLKILKLECNQISGLEEILSNEITKALGQIDILKPFIEKKINETTQASFNISQKEINAKLIEKKSSFSFIQNKNLFFKLSQFNDKWISFKIISNSNSEIITDEDFNFEDELDQKYISHSPYLFIVPKTQVENELKTQLNQIARQNTISSREIPELDKLTRSRFKQFFAWRALMKRPKGIELKIKPMIEKVELNLPLQKSVKSIQYKLISGAWVFDQADPMLYLRTNISASTVIIQNQQNYQLNSTFNLTPVTPIWDKNYLSKYRASDYIKTSVVDAPIHSYFNQNWAVKNLDLIKLDENKSLKFSDIFLDTKSKIYFSFN